MPFDTPLSSEDGPEYAFAQSFSALLHDPGIPAAIKNKIKLELGMQGKLPGLLASGHILRDVYRSLALHGQHEDDEEKQRENDDFIQNWLRHLREMMDWQIGVKIKTLRAVISTELNKVNALINDVATATGSGATATLSSLKSIQTRLRARNTALDNLDTARRSARGGDDLESVSAQVDNEAAQVDDLQAESQTARQAAEAARQRRARRRAQRQSRAYSTQSQSQQSSTGQSAQTGSDDEDEEDTNKSGGTTAAHDIEPDIPPPSKGGKADTHKKPPKPSATDSGADASPAPGGP
ncbi:MAG: hypothetical protein ACPGRX_01225 [Bdellovibrionales bacterium]